MNEEMYEFSLKTAGQGFCRATFESAIHSSGQGDLI
jgi:hypothetical protein